LVECLIPKVKRTDTVIYQIHGGGYVFRYQDFYRDLALKYSDAAGGAVVISIDYHCAPSHVFPSALEESVAVYQWILEQGYKSENIVIVGDSAGGNLTLVTTMYLRDHQMPMPKGIITISPWTDFACDYPSITANKENDLVLGWASEFLYGIILDPPYGKGTDFKNPYLSPVCGDYHYFPPMLVQCGSNEVLLDQIKAMVEHAKADGANVTYQLYLRMSHDFQYFLPMTDEAEEAWSNIQTFLKEV